MTDDRGRIEGFLPIQAISNSGLWKKSVRTKTKDHKAGKKGKGK